MADCSLKSMFSSLSTTLSCFTSQSKPARPKPSEQTDALPSPSPVISVLPSPTFNEQEWQQKQKQQLVVNLAFILQEHQITSEEAMEQLMVFLDQAFPQLKKNLSIEVGEQHGDIQPIPSKPVFLEPGWSSVVGLLNEAEDNDIDTIIAQCLNTLEPCNWILLGILCIGGVLDRLFTVNSYQRNCILLLEMIGSFAKQINQLDQELAEDVQNTAAQVMMKNSLVCFDYINRSRSSKYLDHKTMEQQTLDACAKMVSVLCMLDLTADSELLSFVQNLGSVFSFRSPSIDQILTFTTVGLESKIEAVKRMLRMDSTDDKATAGILWGHDGIGKSTLAAALIESCKKTGMKNFKFAKISFDNTRSDKQTHIKELQQSISMQVSRKGDSQIDLSGTGDGRQRLKNLFLRHPCVLLIHHLEHRDDLRQLLPHYKGSDGDWPRMLRVIITCRNNDDLRNEFSSAPWKCMDYHVPCLPHEESKTLLQVTVMGRDRDMKTRFARETHKLKQVAKLCKGVPLLLTTVGRYLRDQREENKYDAILEKLREEGKDPGTSKIVNLLLFICKSMEDRLQHAFLDAFRYFDNWEFEEASLAIGRKEIEDLINLDIVQLDCDGRVVIHHILKTIARKESRKETISNADQWCETVLDKEELKNITGIWLDKQWTSKEQNLTVDTADLEEMHQSLRILCLGRGIILNDKRTAALEQLKYLHLQNLQLEDFPFEKLKNLICLNMEGIERIQEFPQVFYPATQMLKKLTISACPTFKDLPEELGNLASLESLVLSKCPRITTMPRSLGSLRALKRLHILNCENLQELPPELCNLTSLIEFILQDCKTIKKLPPNFSELSKLELLKIHGCSAITALPEEVGNLESLKSLLLSACPMMKNLPEDMGRKLSSLQTLKIRKCGEINELPQGICQMQKLLKLTIVGCPLRNLPQEFRGASFPVLQKLKLKGVGLRELPSSCLEAMTELKKLDLSYNPIHSLPEDLLKDLQQLESLDLSLNEMHSFPEGFFASLKHLKTLNMSSCYHLDSLPDDVGNLAALEEMSLLWSISLRMLPQSLSRLPNLLSLNLCACLQLPASALDEALRLRSLRSLSIGGSQNLLQRWSTHDSHHFPTVNVSSANPPACNVI